MTEIGHLPCPFVSCGSSDAFSYNADKRVGKCHSCGEGYPSKYEVFDWAKDKYPVSISKGFVDLSVVEPFTPKGIETGEGKFTSLRGITSKTMEVFNVKTYGHLQEYVYPSGGVKVRDIEEKSFYAKNGFKGDELFGMNVFPAGCAKTLTVTEGELDCLSAYQMLSANNSYINPVVSVPSATPSSKFWTNTRKYFDSFEKIILSFDNDDAGKTLTKKFAEIYPDKVFVLNHGNFKDANDFLVAGQGREYKQHWWNVKRYKPDTVLSDADDYLKLYRDTADFEYFETGIPELDDKILGICKGYITLIIANTGIGKSEVMRYFEYQLLKNTDYKVATCRKEETKLRSLLGLVSYEVGDNVTIKKNIEDKGLSFEVEDAIKNLTENERFITFSIDETQSNEETMKQFRYLVAAMDVDFIFVEPVQDIVTGAGASEKEGKLSDLITQMGNLCGETNVGFVLIAHQNNDGGAMYSSMITKKAGFKIKLKADREHEDPTERNKTYLYVEEKNRVGRGFGPAGTLEFNPDTYTLKPVIKVEPSVAVSDDIPF